MLSFGNHTGIVKTKYKHCLLWHHARPSSFLAEIGMYYSSYKARGIRKRWDCDKNCYGKLNFSTASVTDFQIIVTKPLN